jgi:tetratricopeptide (TPR) repeat protein
MAQEQLTAGQIEKRISAGEQAAAVLGIGDEQIKAMMALGYNQYQQGRLQEAEKLFRGVAALNTESYLGYAGLGAVALAKKPADLDTAFACLTRAAELRPDDGAIQANLGEVLLRQGKLQEATPHLEKAFKLDPNRKDAGVNRARAIVAGLDILVTEAEKRQKAKAN